jgi:hypothetical protein
MSLSAFTRDANQFIINFSLPISDYVPHIYLSVLQSPNIKTDDERQLVLGLHSSDD